MVAALSKTSAPPHSSRSAETGLLAKGAGEPLSLGEPSAQHLQSGRRLGARHAVIAREGERSRELASLTTKSRSGHPSPKPSSVDPESGPQRSTLGKTQRVLLPFCSYSIPKHRERWTTTDNNGGRQLIVVANVSPRDQRVADLAVPFS